MRVLLALVLLLGLTAATPQTTTLPDVEDEVMCVECGTALNVSTSPVADQERGFIRERIAEGMDKEQIKAALVEEYGPDVLAEPEQTSAWLVPTALAAAALLGVLLVARRWRGGSAETRTPPELDPEDQSRLNDDLAAFDR